MIYFSIPDFWINYKLNIFLLDLMQEHSEYFLPDIKIDSIYGSFPCIWNGGRILRGYTDAQNIISTVKAFNDRDLSVRFTFTNSELSKADYLDVVGNTILQLNENNSVKNGVTLVDEKFKNYINKNYTNYYFCYSTSMCINSVEEINRLSKNNIVVLNYNLNHNKEILKQLKYKEHIEILCDEICPPNCPYRKQHYKNISKYNLYQQVNIDCLQGDEKRYYYRENNSHVTIDEIKNYYEPLGFNHFKLNGRGESIINVIERYVCYLVKPEYKDKVRNIILLNVI